MLLLLKGSGTGIFTRPAFEGTEADIAPPQCSYLFLAGALVGCGFCRSSE